jgi:hypothetical protein
MKTADHAELVSQCMALTERALELADAADCLLVGALLAQALDALKDEVSASGDRATAG